MTSIQRLNLDSSKLLFAAVLFFFGFSICCYSQDTVNSKVKDEIAYAQFLTEIGLPTYAKTVLDKIDDPSAGAIIKTLRIQGLVSRGEWAKVKSIIGKEPDQNSVETWAMKLSLADGYYAWKMYPEAQGIYESLLKKYPNGPPEALNDFFTSSSYRYAQMLLLMGKQKDAIRVYEEMAKAKLPKHERRQIITETAELMVQQAESSKSATEQKALFEKINKITTEILWVQDIWFGKAIVILAHIKKIQGDVPGAIALMDDYKDSLLALDADLKASDEETGGNMTKLSPMAQCRYLLGVMMQDQANELIASGGSKSAIVDLLVGPKKAGSSRRSAGAYKHFMNVFVQYPSTAWAPEAGVRAKQVREILIAPPFNAKIKETITDEILEKVEAAQFKNAEILYSQNQYKESAVAYLQVLNLFPESKSAVTALGNLTQCYIEEDDELMAMTTLRYLAERFSSYDKFTHLPGDQIIRIAMKYSERNQNTLSDEVYEVFFLNFPKHPSSVSLLYRAADTKFKAEDYAGALVYYTMIKDEHPGVPLWYASLSRITSCYSKMGDSKKELVALKEYITGLEARPRPGAELIGARYREALAYKKMGGKAINSAFNRLTKLAAILTGTGREKYEDNPDQKKQNDNILQGVYYNKASCYMKMKPPKGKDETYRKKQAIQLLEKLVKDFPESQFSASALSQIGTLWTVLDKPKEAGIALKRLQKEYPKSAEAKNASFMLGMNLLKMGRKQQSVEVFREMFASTGKYSDYQIFAAGTELKKAGEIEIALSAYEQVLATSKARSVVEPSLLYQAECLIAKEEYVKSAKSLERLLNDYPRSSYTTKATLLLSEAYSEMAKNETDTNKRIGIFNKAVEALIRSRSFEKLPEGHARLDVELSRIYKRKYDAELEYGDKTKAARYLNESIAAYQKLILFGNPEAAGVTKYIETAYAECLPLLLETERWSDVMEDSAAYIKTYPNGKNIRAVRSIRGKAKVKLASQGNFSSPTAAEPEEDTEPEESTAVVEPTVAEKSTESTGK